MTDMEKAAFNGIISGLRQELAESKAEADQLDKDNRRALDECADLEREIAPLREMKRHLSELLDLVRV